MGGGTASPHHRATADKVGVRRERSGAITVEVRAEPALREIRQPRAKKLQPCVLLTPSTTSARTHAHMTHPAHPERLIGFASLACQAKAVFHVSERSRSARSENAEQLQQELERTE